MSTPLLIGLVLVVAGLVCLAFWWRSRDARLPDDDWFEGPGAIFLADHEQRVARYALARGSQNDLAVLVAATKVELAGEWTDAARVFVQGLLRDSDRALAQLEQILDARDRGFDRLSVVLFGRTKAGKSSLYAALSGTGFDGIGRGGQNFTREVRGVDLGGVRLIDTPGVDGVGSAPLESATIAAVHEADILVVEVTDDAVFAEDFERLGGLALSTRPYVVALNVGKGDTELVVRSPERVFRDERLDQHKRRLRMALPDGTSDDAPIVPYHALSAAQAREHPRADGSQALWDASRIRLLIAEIVSAAPAATKFARASADEAVETACRQFALAQADTEALVVARCHALRRTISELKGILSEVSMASSSNGGDVVDAHYADAEEALLEALEVSDADTFRLAVARTLNPERLNDALTEILQGAAASLSEKFDEFQADVRLAMKVVGHEDAFAGVHSRYQLDQLEREQTRQQAIKRRFLRAGAKAAVGIAAFAFIESGPGAAVVALAGSEVVDRVLPPIELAKDDPASRRAALQELIAQESTAARRDFQTALEGQLLEPARNQLIAPLTSEVEDLERLRAIVAATSASVDAVRSGVASRREPRSTPTPVRERDVA